LTLPFWQPIYKNVPCRFARLSQVAAYSCRQLLDRRPAVPSALSIEVDSGQDGQNQALSAVRLRGNDDPGVFCEGVRERHPVCVIEPNQCAGAAKDLRLTTHDTKSIAREWQWSMRKVSIRQVKAARALLAWSQGDAARNSGVSVPTIKRLEALDGVIGGRADTSERIVAALEAAGVIFIEENGGGPGVRLRNAPSEDR
jgi:hypothetical protein